MSGSNLFSGAPVCIVGNLNRDVKLLNVPASSALLDDGETSVPAVIETVGGGGPTAPAWPPVSAQWRILSERPAPITSDNGWPAPWKNWA
jgi:hypothetical protein